ncbi:SDR family NAD(P)-dependent oxidoreductase [Citromicrobium bathyomarinum]|uniref:SDR family NAD(P)-dependent oxidoreductase n=1 Tax=Citromicrobium bathyomarinum TaxID=72174 RepID=UPI00315B0C23
MPKLFIFGLGYSAGRIAREVQSLGWEVVATGSEGKLSFDDRDAVVAELASATHVLSSVPPDRESGLDPVLSTYGHDFAPAWYGYLSSTGVYGDAGGAWVDESSPTGTGRRSARSDADRLWLELGARIFRLPGIYGPGRSIFERIEEGKAKRIDLPGQVFSRIHVDDIASGVVAGLTASAPPGAYNLGDDLPASQNAVVEEACALLGVAPPPLISLEEADLSPMARGFYAENRRVANLKAKRVLRWQPRYPTFREGLRSLL